MVFLNFFLAKQSNKAHMNLCWQSCFAPTTGSSGAKHLLLAPMSNSCESDLQCPWMAVERCIEIWYSPTVLQATSVFHISTHTKSVSIQSSRSKQLKIQKCILWKSPDSFERPICDQKFISNEHFCEEIEQAEHWF